MCCRNAYGSYILMFLEKLQELLGDNYSNLDSLNNLEKTSYVLGSELAMVLALCLV